LKQICIFQLGRLILSNLAAFYNKNFLEKEQTKRQRTLKGSFALIRCWLLSIINNIDFLYRCVLLTRIFTFLFYRKMAPSHFDTGIHPASLILRKTQAILEIE